MASKTTPTYTSEQWNAMLVAGGRYEGVTNIQAAVHLLTHTDLPGHWQFTKLVNISSPVLRGDDGNLEDAPTLVAVVHNWLALPNLAADLQKGSSTIRLLTLAASLAKGIPVDMRDCLTGFGHAAARRAAEAVLISSGYDEWYTVAGTSQFNDYPAIGRVDDHERALQVATEGGVVE